MHHILSNLISCNTSKKSWYLLERYKHFFINCFGNACIIGTSENDLFFINSWHLDEMIHFCYYF